MKNTNKNCIWKRFPNTKKLILTMKLTSILIFMGVLQVSASVYSQQTRMTFSMTDKTVKEVLDQIEQTTDFRFFYNENFTNLNEHVTIVARDNRVEEILDGILDSTDVTFKIMENNLIVIAPKSLIQQQKVTGKVTDATTGEPLPGVNVRIEGTNIGTITDIGGNYTIEVPAQDAVIQFSFIGYITESVSVAGKLQIDITLKAEISELDEVIIVGYGTQSKRTITGSIQSVVANEIKDIPVTQVTQQLQGKLAGVQINQATGIPGREMYVRIRGAGSLSAGSNPLYVVDGFPITGDLTNINPEEIETISILKDAASTALYGSRAANGVVLITTKRGTSGKSEIGFNAYYGFQALPKKGIPEVMNGTEFAQFKKESYEDLSQPVPAAFQNPEQYGAGYNWYDAMFRTAPIQDYTLSLSNRGDKFSVATVAGYMNQEGIMINSGYSRYSLRINSDYKVNDKVKMQFNLAPTYTSRYNASSDGIFWAGGLLINALLAWPILPYENPDGTLPISSFLPGLSAFPSPNYYRAAREIKTTTNTSRILSNISIAYEPIKGLVLKSAANIEMGSENTKNFQPSTSTTGFAVLPPVTATLNLGSNSSLSWLLENTVTYSKKIGDHNFEAMAGYTTQKYKFNSMGIRATTFPDDRISDVDAATTLQMNGTDSDIQEWSLISYLGRLNYDFRGKYLISVLIRRDGSSRFGSENKWGNFPSVSVGWIASEENFFPKNNVLTFMKIRGSYGLTGNNNIGNYTSYANVNLGANYVFGTTIASGSYVSSLANPYLGWETTSQLDIGTDIGFLDNRISLTYDYYSRKTYDMLYNFTIPQSSGFGSFTGNSGELKFWGHEIAITSRNMVGNFKWTSNVNITFGDNKVVSLAPNVDAIYQGGHISRVGQRLGLFWGLIQDGVYDNQEEYDNSAKAAQSAVGTIKFKDVNGDGAILNTNTGGDLTVIGDPTPKYLFGITNTFSFKNFDLSVIASGSVGNDIANRFEQGTTNLDGPFNILKEIKYRWRSPSDPGLGKYGTTTRGTFMERDWFNSRFINDGTFLTIKNITLGYNVPVSKVKFMSRLRVYASVQQAFVFTKYKGNNPEVSNSANVLTLGDDNTSYPVARTFTFGVNMGF
jgi:TonB-linked SusC/RagA family outer membrane protein